jgi:hypothetical protein
MEDNTNKKNEGTPIYLTPDSTLQTAEEKDHDASIDPRKDDTISVSQDDLREPDRQSLSDETREDSSR